MDPPTIVNWLRANQDNESLFDDDTFPYGPIRGTPAEMFLTFCAYPDVLHPFDVEEKFGP